MKKAMKPHTCKANNASAKALSVRNDSHMITNFKPKIRIIHIFAPEIIKTDVANFRELVQRLTGKPEGRKGGNKKAKKAMSSANNALGRECCKPKADESEISNEYQNSGEEEMWVDQNSSFFGGLGDLEGFLQGLGEFPLVPMSSSSMSGFSESRETSFLV